MVHDQSRPLGVGKKDGLDNRRGRTLSNEEVRFPGDCSDASDTRYPVPPLAQLIRIQVSW